MTAQVAPLIGLTGRRKKASQIVGTPESLWHLEGDWYYADYARGVIEAGGLPVHLPLDLDPAALVGRLDGILLSGGADIGPDNYGAAAETDDFPPEPERDAFELSVLAHASERAMPVLGICRGLQMINVFAGGTLHQHVPEHARFDDDPNTRAHSVTIAANSQLGQIYGPSHQVNSLHHQTIDRLGESLVAAAVDGDTVEGVEHKTLPIVGVQWHPEMLDTRSADPIFGWLVDAARSHASSFATT